MIERNLILIDDQDQRATLRKLETKLREAEGVKLNFVHINPRLPKFLVFNEKSNKQEQSLEKIIEEIVSIDFFYRADAIAIDYNLVQDGITGFELAVKIRDKGYKKQKEILLYSAKIDDAINFILSQNGQKEKIKSIKRLIDSNVNFATRGEDFYSIVIENLKKNPKFNFEDELTKWLYQYGEGKFKAFFPDYNDYSLAEIAKEIDKDSIKSQQFRKEIVEQIFSNLIALNELE